MLRCRRWCGKTWETWQSWKMQPPPIVWSRSTKSFLRGRVSERLTERSKHMYCSENWWRNGCDDSSHHFVAYSAEASLSYMSYLCQHPPLQHCRLQWCGRVLKFKCMLSLQIKSCKKKAGPSQILKRCSLPFVHLWTVVLNSLLPLCLAAIEGRLTSWR